MNLSAVLAAGGLCVAPMEDGTPTNSANIDSALVMGTSGDAWILRFLALEDQTSATLTLYAYCSAVTGSPTFEMEVWATSGSDMQRPDTAGAALSSSPNSVTPVASEWATFTCTVSLTQNVQYFCVIKNTHATPASNHAAFRVQGALRAWFANPSASRPNATFVNGHTTDGFSTDPTLATASTCACVLKYASGTLAGNPYVSDDSTHASNTSSRGNRYTFDEDVVVSGIFGGGAGASVSSSHERIYTTAGSLVAEGATSAETDAQGGAVFFDPTTLSGGTAYDVVVVFSSNSSTGTAYTMGEAEGDLPTDVLACRPFACANVDGATPGSYTVDTSKIVLQIGPLVAEIPAISGGGGSDRRQTMTGGLAQ